MPATQDIHANSHMHTRRAGSVERHKVNYLPKLLKTQRRNKDTKGDLFLYRYKNPKLNLSLKNLVAWKRVRKGGEKENILPVTRR